MINDKFVQIHGPFIRYEDIINKIKVNFPDFQYIKSIGIQCEPTHYCYINEQLFEIGKTGILESHDVHITSLYFTQDEPENVLIDCILE